MDLVMQRCYRRNYLLGGRAAPELINANLYCFVIKYVLQYVTKTLKDIFVGRRRHSVMVFLY